MTNISGTQFEKVDLGAFAERIGFEGDFSPTLECLNRIAMGHVCSIPFENLDILLRQPVLLDANSLQQKLVYERRGGYCFEQNGLALLVLREIGFDVTPLSGRVRQDRPRDFTPPRTHLFLKVNLDGTDWIYDAGVGGMSLTGVIRDELDIEQSTPHETRRIVREEGKFFHQVQSGAEWKDAYDFSGEEMPEIDREVASWWTSTSPNAKFSQNLMCAIAMPDGSRKGIMNNRFLARRGAEIMEEVVITTGGQLLDILGEHFGLRFPAGTRFGEGEKPWPTL